MQLSNLDNVVPYGGLSRPRVRVLPLPLLRWNAMVG